MRKTLLLTILTVGMTAAATAEAGEPISVVLDSWWNVDYAKNYCREAIRWRKEDRAIIAAIGCDIVTLCTQMMPIVEACQGNGPDGGVHDFEDKLVTYLAADPQCKDVHFTRFGGPSGEQTPAVDAMERDGHWMLFLDYLPGAAKQSWTLIRKKPYALTKGSDDPKKMAESVCAIATGQGAKLD